MGECGPVCLNVVVTGCVLTRRDEHGVGGPEAVTGHQLQKAIRTGIRMFNAMGVFECRLGTVFWLPIRLGG